VLAIELRAGSEPFAATQAVQERLAGVARQLPMDGPPPVVSLGQPDAPADRAITIEGSGLHGAGDLARHLVRDRLQREPGIARVDVTGAERRIEVHLEAAKLVAYDVTVTEVARAITIGNLPSGRDGVAIRVDSELRGPEDLGALAVGERGVKLRDVARVEDTVRGGAPVIAVWLQRGGDPAAIDKALDELRPQLPAGVTLHANPVPRPVRAVVILTGPDREVLAARATAALRAVPGAKAMHAAVEITQAIDRARAADLGVDASELVRTIAVVAGEPVATLTTHGKRLDIIMDIDDRERLRVRSRRVGTIAFADVTRTTTGTVEVRTTFDRMPSIELVVERARGEVEDQLAAVRAALPAGYRAVVR
jgi:multidrug efflux pump subunit AcrB